MEQRGIELLAFPSHSVCERNVIPLDHSPGFKIKFQVLEYTQTSHDPAHMDLLVIWEKSKLELFLECHQVFLARYRSIPAY